MQKRSIVSALTLILWITILLLVSSAIGALTKSSIDSWYVALNRSPLTPPNYMFGIVWSILYVMIAISGWMIWRSEYTPKLKAIKTLYITQLLLNWSWTPLFFGYHLVGTALICLIVITIVVALLIIKSYKNLVTVSTFLTPYFLWLLFATYLNLYIWLYN